MNFPEICLKKYPQYDLQWWKKQDLFKWNKKSIFTSTITLNKEAISKKEHLKTISMLIFLYEITRENLLLSKGYDAQELADKKAKVQNLWASLFEYELYKNETPLIYAYKNAQSIVSDQIMEYWDELKKNSPSSIYTTEDEINNFIKSCKYIPSKTSSELGSVRFPNHKKEKSFFNKITQMAQDISFAFIETDVKRSIIEIQAMNEDERIKYAQKYFKNNTCYKKESQKLFDSLMSLHHKQKHYHLKEPLFMHEYAKMMNSHLIELINFAYLIGQSKNNSFQEQLELIYKI